MEGRKGRLRWEGEKNLSIENKSRKQVFKVLKFSDYRVLTNKSKFRLFSVEIIFREKYKFVRSP